MICVNECDDVVFRCGAASWVSRVLSLTAIGSIVSDWFRSVCTHVLRRIAGHGSLATTQRYLHLDAEYVTAAGESADRVPEPTAVPKWSPAPCRERS